MFVVVLGISVSSFTAVAFMVLIAIMFVIVILIAVVNYILPPTAESAAMYTNGKYATYEFCEYVIVPIFYHAIDSHGFIRHPFALRQKKPLIEERPSQLSDTSTPQDVSAKTETGESPRDDE